MNDTRRPKRTPVPRRARRFARRFPARLARGALLAAMAACWTPAAIQAQPSAAPRQMAREPVFLLETISVEGTDRISKDILVSNARLVEGGEYTEVEIRDAIARIRRLPFVLTAEPRLRRGSERGRYELVIEVVPTSRFFSSYALFATYQEPETFVSPFEPPDGGPPQTVEVGGDLDFTSERFELGYRFFVGAHGVAFVSTDSGLGVAAGYTQYRLLDTNAYLSFAVRRSLCCDAVNVITDEPDVPSSTSDATGFSLVLGIPLAPRQSIQIEAEAVDGTARTDFVVEEPSDPNAPPTTRRVDIDSRTRGLGVRWVYDTTDEPILPRRGFRMLAGVGAQRSETGAGLSGLPESDSIGASVSAVRYRPFGRRNAWSLGLDAGFGRTERVGIDAPGLQDVDSWNASVNAGYYRTFRLPRSARGGELRGELVGGYSVTETSPESPFQIQNEAFAATASLVYRNRFTVVRLGLGYFDGEGR